MTQYGLDVTDFYQPRDGDLEEHLRKLNVMGKSIISVMCLRHEWRKDGSNHGHGGAYDTHYQIVSCVQGG